ncbi:MAG: radical SAM family heme chaperone HemW [Alphaproteobacteria bacterium]|nr:radical SAM family heme chaperone HemW [Alphaproteobacteria bacterium]
MIDDQRPTTKDPLAVYIHWPFCKAKCPYCDFNSHVRDRVDFSAWKKALLTELEHMATLAPERIVTSIFFGGGTPSLMPPEIAEAAIARVRALWPCDENSEITLEANPTSVEADTFPAFKQAGINRLSIGVQSLRPEALKFLGREHSADEAMQALALARKYFERYSFDLIYARPGHTPQEWEDELREALALARGHISLYQLTIEENTAFHTAYAKGAFTLPDEETAAQLYELTTRITGEHGMTAYEVSNYAAPGHESRHNMAYWLGHDYIGVGPGAHGRLYLEGVRHATLNLKSPERWLSAVSEQGHGLESNLPMTAQTIAEERLMMGLRITGGLPVSEVRDYIDEKKRRMAIAEGLLEHDEAHLIPTAKGRLVLTSLTKLLLRDV